MPVTHEGPSGKSVSLEELIALNEEIVSLAPRASRWSSG